MKKVILYWVPLAAYMAVVLYLSVGQESYETLDFKYMDKVNHLGAYSVMGLLWARGLSVSGVFRKRPVLAAFLISFLYGLLIEGLQALTPNRLPEAADAAVNGIGAFSGAYAYIFFSGLFSRGKEERCS